LGRRSLGWWRRLLGRRSRSLSGPPPFAFGMAVGGVDPVCPFVTAAPVGGCMVGGGGEVSLSVGTLAVAAFVGVSDELLSPEKSMGQRKKYPAAMPPASRTVPATATRIFFFESPAPSLMRRGRGGTLSAKGSCDDSDSPSSMSRLGASSPPMPASDGATGGGGSTSGGGLADGSGTSTIWGVGGRESGMGSGGCSIPLKGLGPVSRIVCSIGSCAEGFSGPWGSMSSGDAERMSS
jgi:hypothetical protein